MIRDFERYHGVVLRELIAKASGPLEIESVDCVRGTVIAVNKNICVTVKHSSKRVAPWLFGFTDHNLKDLKNWTSSFSSVWLALVCGPDGFLTLNLSEFEEINVRSDVAKFIRIDRNRNTMYRVFGNAGRLQVSKPRGLNQVILELAREALV